MTNKTLVVFGDSWPAGAELADVKMSFPILLSNMLGIKCINAAKPASSIEESVFTFLSYFKNYEDPFFPWQGFGWFNKLEETEFIVLFCLSGKSRHWKITGNNILEIHPHNTDTISVNYYKYLHTEEQDNYNLIKNIILVQEVCKRYNTPCYFVSNWGDLPKFHMIDATNVYNKTLTQILDLPMVPLDNRYSSDLGQANLIDAFENSIYVYPNQAHPNQLGHEKIAHELYQWIKN